MKPKFNGQDWTGLRGNIVKNSKGKAGIKNASSKMGVGALAAKKPSAKALKRGSNPGAKVSGKTAMLAAKSPKKLKSSSKGPIAHGKGRRQKISDNMVF